MIKKALLVVCAFLFGGYITASAQTYLQMRIGPYVSMKGGVNVASIPEGKNTGMTINMPPDFGVTFFQPFNKKKSSFAIMFDIGYNTSSYLSKPDKDANGGKEATDDQIMIYSVHHLQIAPAFHIKGFVLGLNLGFPLSAQYANKSGTIKEDFKTTDQFSGLSEVRIGGMIPLIEDETGVLNLNIFGAYALSGISANDNSSSNPTPASLSIGLSYLLHVSDR